MVSVFSILKDIGSVIKILLPIVTKVLSVALRIAAVIVKLVTNFIKFVAQLDLAKIAFTAIEKAGGVFAFVLGKIKEGLDNLKNILTDTTTLTGKFAMKLKDVATTVLTVVAGALYLAFSKIKDVISSFNVKDPLGSLVNGVKALIAELKQLPVIRDVINALEIAFGYLEKAFKRVSELAKTFVNDIKSGMSVFRAFGNTISTVIGDAVGLFTKLIGYAKDFISSFSIKKTMNDEFEMPIRNADNSMKGVYGTLERTSDGVKKTEKSFGSAKNAIVDFGKTLINKVKQIEAGQILLFGFGTAVIILALNLSKLASSLSSVATGAARFMAGFGNFLENFGKKKSTFFENMLGISLGIAALAGALYTMSKIDLKTLVISSAILTNFIAMFGIFSAIGSKTGGAFAAALASFASGIVILIAAMYALDRIEWNHLAQDAIILGSIVAAMVAVSILLSKFAPQFSKGGLAMIAFGASVYLLAKALEVIGKVDLDNITRNWKALTLVILSFAAFSAMASNIGIGAALGLISFIVVLKVLLKNTETAKKYMKNVQDAFYFIADAFKSAVSYIHNGLKTVAEEIEKCKALGALIGAGIVGIIGTILAIGYAGKGIRKIATAFVLIAAAIAGLTFVIAKISQMKGINTAVMDRAIGMVNNVMNFLVALSAITVISDLINLKSTSKNSAFKDMRKMLTSMALLMVSIGAFAAMVGSLSADQFERAKSVLIWTEVIVGILASIGAIITATASRAGKTDVSFGTFAGIIALIGAYIGAMAVLMYMFSQVDFEEDKKKLLAVAGSLLGITAAIALILKLISDINKNKKQSSAFKAPLTITSIALFIAAIGGTVYKLLQATSNEGDLKRAGIILGALLAFMSVLAGSVIALEAISKQMLNTKIRQNAFMKTMAAIGMMVGSIVVLALVANGLKSVNPANTLMQFFTLTAVLGGLIAFVVSLQRFSKDTKYSITDTSQKSMIKTLEFVGLFILAFGLLATIAYGLREVRGDRLLAQFAGMTLVIGSLIAFVVSLQRFSKDTKYSITKTSQKSILKTLGFLELLIVAIGELAVIGYALRDVDAGRMIGQMETMVLVLTELGAIMTGCAMLVKYGASPAQIAAGEGMLQLMVGIFATLAAVFVGIDKLISSDATGILKKSEIISLVLTELGGIAAGCAMLGRYAGAGNAAKGGAVLTLMVGIFGVLSAVFWIIDGLKTEGILAKSQAIVLCLVELGAIAVGCGMLWQYAGEGKIFAGEVALLALVGVFAALTQVFKVIDGLKTEGILAKSQSIILCLVELGGIAAGLGLSVKWQLLGALGSIGLWAILGCFAVLVQIFKVIDRLKTEGILAKSQTIILVLLELTLMAPLMLGDVFGLVGFVGLYAMLGAFAILAQIFKVIDGLHTEGLLKKSQTIVLVMLELVLLAPLMLFDIAGLAGAPGLLALLGCFAILANIFIIIDSLHVEGLLQKSQILVLVLLELQGLAAVLGAISPLAMAAAAGIPSIIAMSEAMVIIASAIAKLSDINPAQAQQSVDMLVNALWALIPIGAAGSVAGPGLMLLSTGIIALGAACAAIGGGLQVFAAGALAIVEVIERLIKTGPGITTWSLSVSASITMLSTSVMMASKSVVASVNSLITGIIMALKNGVQLVFGASGEVGSAVDKGIHSKLDPIKWGKDLVINFANGIKSGIGNVQASVASIAKTVWSYLHFTEPETGAMVGLPSWGYDAMLEYAGGILKGETSVGDACTKIGSTVSSKLKSLDFSSLGQTLGQYFGNGIYNGSLPGLNSLLEAIGLVEAKAKNLMEFQKSKAYTGVLSDYAYQLQNTENKLNRQKTAIENVEKAQQKFAGRAGQTAEKSKYLADRLEGVNKELNENKKAQNELLGITEDAAAATDDFSDSLDGLGDSAGGAGKGTKEAKDEIADFYDMIKGAINLFEEFNTETDLTSEKLLENMRSQINGVVEWSGQIAELAKRGIDQGLLKTLADMGPQGYQYTKAFVGMTEDQLKEASSLYEKSLILPQAVTSHVYSSFAWAGQQSAQGFFNGLTQDSVRDQGIAFAKNLLSGIEGAAGLDINSPSRKTYLDGVYAGLGFKDGLGSNAVLSTLRATVSKICRNTLEWFKDGLPKDALYSVGRSVVEGLKNGINSGEGDLRSAITTLCTKVKEAAKSKQNFDINSPSRVFMTYGKYIDEGLAKGIIDNVDMATQAIGKTSQSMINEMRDIINKANETLIDDVEDPVIKPVLDLSDVRYGSNQINSIFSQNRALSASASFNTLQNAQLSDKEALINATSDNSDVVGAIDSLKEDILSLKDAMTNMQMVLDTGTMVGAITPAIDQQLYTRQVYAGRGI